MVFGQTKIGFIGLGLMGAPMATNLLNAGARLIVYNRTLAKSEGLAASGAKVANTPSEVAQVTGSGFIFLCVSDTGSLAEAIYGEGGILSSLVSGVTVIDMGTTGVTETRRFAQLVSNAGGRYIDAPVSGGEVGAKAGTLSIMAGGTIDDIERTRPLFEVLGSTLTHIGPIGTGQAAKAANQTIVGATITIVAEAFAMAQAAGADLSHVRNALLAGFAGSRILDLHGQRMIEAAFTPGARASTQLKDLRQATDLMEELGLSLPLMRKSRDLWEEMIKSGLGDIDQSGYFKFVKSSQDDKFSAPVEPRVG